MRRRLSIALSAACLVASLALAGCSVLPHAAPAGRSPAAWPAPESVGVRSATGCRIDTRIYRPLRPRTDVVAIVAPGFLRDQGHMAGLARALAARGIPAATLSFCNARPWDGRHFRNGLDMRQVARQLGAQRVLYAGFSAGGLAGLAATRTDPGSVGLLALDLLDLQGLGRLLARSADRPLLGLAGEPTACNARGNGLAVYATAPNARVAPVRGAGHCDFESPTDWLCEAVCGPPDRGSAERRRTIIRTAVAAAESLLGLDGGGDPFSGLAARPTVGSNHDKQNGP